MQRRPDSVHAVLSLVSHEGDKEVEAGRCEDQMLAVWLGCVTGLLGEVPVVWESSKK
jgi:hypothetical protein